MTTETPEPPPYFGPHLRASMLVAETMVAEYLANQGIVRNAPLLDQMLAQLFLSGLLFGACAAFVAPEWLQAVEAEAQAGLELINLRDQAMEDPRARTLARIHEAAAAIQARAEGGAPC